MSLSPERECLIITEMQARDAALAALGRWRAGDVSSVRLYAGPGHSGACAAACARHLLNYGVPCLLYVAGGPARAQESFRQQLAAWEKLGGFTTDLLNVDQTLGSLLTLDDDELIINGAVEDEPGGEMPGLPTRIGQALDGALARRSGVVALRFDPAYQSPAPQAADVTVEIDAPPATCQHVRMLDSIAIERYGISGLALMENAGYRAAREAFLMLADSARERVVVLCGRGNNGGDGFVIARYLAGWGVHVDVWLFGTAGQVFDDAQVNLDFVQKAGLEVRELDGTGAAEALPPVLAETDLVVDALLGTGLARPLRTEMLAVVGAINAAGKPVLAVDTPTGLDCDTGRPLGDVVRAQRTVTFGLPKQGFYVGEGPRVTGDIIVADISLPRALLTPQDASR